MRKIYPLVLTVVLAGCTRGVVDPAASRRDSPTARYDNGGMGGSGNIVDPTKTAPVQSSTAAVEQDSVGRNGGMGGSGN
jgi:hypothetical protein